MKASTDEQMEQYINESMTYKSAVVSFIKKLVLITGGMAVSGPGLALGLLFMHEIDKVSKLKDKVGNAKKLKRQYKLIINNLTKSIDKEEEKEEPNEKYVKGLKRIREDIENKMSRLDEFIGKESSINESKAYSLNHILEEYLAEDFYNVDGDASKLEDDAIAMDKGKVPKPTETTPNNDDVPNRDGEDNEKEDQDNSEGSDDNTDESTSDETSEDDTDSEEGEDGDDDSEGSEEDNEDEPKFGNRKVICDRLLDLKEKFSYSLETLYKLDTKNNEKLEEFIAKKINKAIDKISIIIEKQIDTIDYNKLVIYDVYFTEIYLTTNELLKTLI